ncbi:C-reactive protein-like [Hemicordylus capensis]|uniref:C-reactive protein-like n=1 Tax=Hemicordylus capensis TaxID=884348 RepID=UPI0023048AA9|nr:C-reactive protein-like [Hemicordylus capensis]
MELCPLAFLVLTGLLGSLAKEDLERKALVFPAATDTAHVLLKLTPPLPPPLTCYTVCMRFVSDLTRTYALFSYATKAHDNEILIHHDAPHIYSLFMRGGVVTFNVTEKQASPTGWEHVCVSWEASSGLVAFWWNRQPLPRKTLMKGQTISTEASILLGQEQDAFGGGFNINQSFVGEMEDVNMWVRVLSPTEVCQAWDRRPVPDPLINWRALDYEIKGKVIVAPSLAPACRTKYSLQSTCPCP